MTPARWERVKAVFQDAFEREPSERAAWLDAACGGDAELRTAVERLLRGAAVPGPLDAPPVLDPSEAGGEGGDLLPPPSRIGAYRVVRELGRGGMGTVYLAERDEPGLRKTVAVKVVRHGMDSAFVVGRFRNERQILAALEHPGIARLYDGGTTEEGLPYFVMEYVDGEHLLEYSDGRRLPITARLQLFLRVCEAVQYAHQGLVVHRDLKPSNVLVTAAGDPKLLDFGIAKLLSPQQGEDSAEETASFVRLMTPDYASPEQIRGERVTTASDVYSLGVILYELLCGHRPRRRPSGNAREVERAILDGDLIPPSTAAARTEKISARDGRENATLTPAEVGARRQMAPGKLRQRLRGDLDNVVLKALRPQPAERYATAAELGEDLRRHLEGYPVRARAASRAQRAAKFLRRHRAAVTAAAVAIVSLFVGLGVAVHQARLAERERDRARLEAAKATQVSSFLRSLFQSGRPALTGGRMPTVQDILEKGVTRVDTELAGQPQMQAAMLNELGAAHSDLGLYPQAAQLLERSLALGEALGPEGEKDVAASLSALGALEVRMSRYQAARLHLERALAIRERILGPDDPLLAEVLSSLGNVHWYAGRYDEGLASLRRAVAIEEKSGGRRLVSWLTNLSNLEVALDDQEGARRTLERAIAIDSAAEGAVSVRADVALGNVADLLQQQEDFAGARQRLELAMAIDEKTYGLGHPAFPYWWGELGSLHLAMGDLVQARALLERSIQATERTLGPDHAQMATTLDYYGRLQLAEGQPRDALVSLERALRVREKTFGGDMNHNEVAQLLLYVAEAKSLLQDLRAAEEALRRALAIQRKVLVPGHRALVPTLTRLGQTLAARQEPAEARAMLEEAVQIARAKLPPSHSRRVEAETALHDLAARD